VAEGATEFERLNRRMHNKQMIADNRVALLGGRNIGDEYMGLKTEFNFHDLDVLGVGPVARQASAVFDRYWNSDWVRRIPPARHPRTHARVTPAVIELPPEARGPCPRCRPPPGPGWNAPACVTATPRWPVWPQSLAIQASSAVHTDPPSRAAGGAQPHARRVSRTLLR
jgi:phosphatidylserine/phosphatidylglycerophosphate/cardiolipin synthase-like enzyme